MKLGCIWIYVWLGTCDLTSKYKKYLAVMAEDDQTVNITYGYLLKISALVKDLPVIRDRKWQILRTIKHH